MQNPALHSTDAYLTQGTQIGPGYLNLQADLPDPSFYKGTKANETQQGYRFSNGDLGGQESMGTQHCTNGSHQQP